MTDHDQEDIEEQVESGNHAGHNANTDLEPHVYRNGKWMRNNGIRNSGKKTMSVNLHTAQD